MSTIIAAIVGGVLAIYADRWFGDRRMGWVWTFVAVLIFVTGGAMVDAASSFVCGQSNSEAVR